MNSPDPGKHDELRDQLGLYVLGALGPSEQKELEAHLAVCSECGALVRELRPTVEALAELVQPIEPRPAVRQQLLSKIAAVPVTNMATVATPPARPASRSMVSWLAAAASVALAIGLGLYSAQLRNRVLDLEVRLREAITRADTGDRLVADARRSASEAQQHVLVLSSPDLARIDLKGQPVAPAASGQAFWSRSRGLVFTAAALPASPSGKTYQLWVLTAQTPPISNSWLLKPDAAGRVDALFDTPVTMPQPVAIAISLEPEGGVPAPTGDLYLVGKPS
jgi:anti-sigma-K factor RskA